MVQCRMCGQENLDTAVFCGYCGSRIAEGAGRGTMKLSEDMLKTIAERTQERKQIEIPADEASRKGLLRLELIELGYSITIPIKDNIRLGRPDPVTAAQPDIDFTDMAGYRMGVSRHHAEIHWYHDNLLNLYDLGSSNGTHLNGERLATNKAYPLYNGDEIRLGQLGLYVYYEIQADDNFIPFRGPQ